MESSEWLRFAVSLAVWGWDALRATWVAMTWRDVLLLLIFVGVWGVRRNARRAAARLRDLCEKMDDMAELSRLVLKRRDEKVERLEKILGVK